MLNNMRYKYATSLNLSLKTSLIASAAVFLFACSNNKTSDDTQKIESTSPSLQAAYAPYFKIGAAVNRNQTSGQDNDTLALVDEHFNSLTAENDMKWESIQPVEGEFTFTHADKLINYAKGTNKSVIGHVLVWHEQTPDWVFEDENGEPASKELLLSRMKSHINALAGRYKDDIDGWDVVNEALNEDGSMRQSKWYQIIGPEFIDKAFEFAAQAAPNAKLYYNDYNLYKADKMDGAIAMADRLLSKGIRIDGIGEQGHYGAEPPTAQLAASIDKVANKGLTVMITELDISVLKFPDQNMTADISLDIALQEDYNPYANGISAESAAKLANAYTELFKLFLDKQAHIDRVTLWGVSDKDTWRNNWPMKGRTDYPLLFDRQNQAKPFVADLISIAAQTD